MSGALVGASMPRASVILDQSARTWEINVQLNKAFAAEANDKKYTYHILVPRKVGCNFELFNGMSNNKNNFNHYAAFASIANETIDANGAAVWGALTDDDDINVHLQLDNGSDTETSLGCFTKFILNVYVRDGLEMCNLTFCVGGTLYVKCGQTTEGCDKFPVYINYVNVVNAIIGNQTTILDAGNETTIIN